jgi:hypothetical protein
LLSISASSRLREVAADSKRAATHWSIPMSDTSKTSADIITDGINELTVELTALFTREINRLEEHIEELKQELEMAHSRIRELEEALAVATSR